MRHLKTTINEPISVINVGEHNLNTGPDFFNSKLIIGEQLWAGNVEIHVKSSDWFLHNHETDSNYDNVILHVVWEHDTEVFRKDNTAIPTLELSKYVSKQALTKYNKLFNTSQLWINCENDFKTISDFTINNWLDRLYLERLERKYTEVHAVLEQTANDWEAVLFKLLAKNFGLKVNGEAFSSIANSFSFSILRKQQASQLSLEALFLGQAKILSDDVQEPYFLELQKEYRFLQQKFTLSNTNVVPLQFFRLRPANFPTIRLSQLANLYFFNHNLFSKVIAAKSLTALYKLFIVEAAPFWNTHYTFGKTSKGQKKRITKSFIDLLIINTIIPLKYSYARSMGKSIDDNFLLLIQELASEKNTIVDKFNELKPISKSALQSQALIQLKTEFCDKNKCLQCAIGNAILI